MADVKERISIEGNFREQVQAFVNGLIKSRMELKKLVMDTASGSKNINSSINLSTKAINKYATEFVKQGDTVEQAIRKATQKVERYQEGAINRLAKKYMSLGKTITEAYSQAQKDIDIKWNGEQPNKTTPSSIDSFVGSFFGSKFGKGLSVMTAMHMTVKGIEGMFKIANGISDQTLSVMDKLTGGMVSEKGLEYSLKNAIDFEAVKTNIDLLSKNVKGANGEEIYANATKLAVQTRFTEKDMASNAEWMLKGGINPTEQTLKSLANLASLKPELGGEHSGFAVFDAMMGRVTSLKTNYGIDNEKLAKFQKTLSGKDKTETDQALKQKGQGYVIKDKQEWINLFNKYMEKNYGNLAKSQSETFGGLISTLQGQLEQTSSTLMGLNSKDGKIVEGSLVYELKKAIGSSTDKTGLLGWLQELDKSTEFKGLQQSLGGLVKDIVGIGQTLSESGFIDDMLNVFSSFADEVSNFIQELKSSGDLDKILSDIPKLVKASLDYELAKVKALEKAEPLIPLAVDFLHEMTDFIEELTGNKEKSTTIMGKNYVKPNTETAKGGWLSNLFDLNTKKFDDYSAKSYIEGSNISAKEKETVKETIEHDNINKYEIHIEGGENYDDIARKLVQAIENAQANRK